MKISFVWSVVLLVGLNGPVVAELPAKCTPTGLAYTTVAQSDYQIGTEVEVQMGGGWRPGTVTGTAGGGYVVKAADIYGIFSEMLYSSTMIRRPTGAIQPGASQGAAYAPAPQAAAGTLGVGSQVEVSMGGGWRPGLVTGTMNGGYIVKASDIYGNFSEMLYSGTMIRQPTGQVSAASRPDPAPVANPQPPRQYNSVVEKPAPRPNPPATAGGGGLAGTWYYASGESDGANTAVYGTLKLGADGRYEQAQRINGSLLYSLGTWSGAGGNLRLTPDPGRGAVQNYSYYIGTQTDVEGRAFEALTLRSTSLSLLLTKEKR